MYLHLLKNSIILILHDICDLKKSLAATRATP